MPHDDDSPQGYDNPVARVFDELEVTVSEAAEFMESFTPLVQFPHDRASALYDALFRETNRRVLADPDGRQAAIWLAVHAALTARALACVMGAEQLGDEAKAWLHGEGAS